MNRKLSLFIFGLFVFISLNSFFVSAIGITPGRANVEYVSGLESTHFFSVLNSEHKSMEVIFSVQGELAEYVVLNQNRANFSSNDENKQFSYSFDLPDSLKDKPGIHSAEIVALEIPSSRGSGVYIGATVAVASQLQVRVPYPGKFVESDLNVLDAEENSSATFIVPVVNRGKLGIGEVRAIIDVYDSFNNKIETINTDYWELGVGKRTELSGKWNVNVKAGDYLAKVSVFYDGETLNLEKQFSVGIRSLSVESILVRDFQLGEIAKLQILVENRWSEELRGVFANLLVYNDDNQVMADVSSSSEDIPALSQKELIAYWDTIGVQEGEYNGKLMVRYGEKSSDRNLVLEISETNLNIFGVGYAIRSEGGKGIDVTQILIILIILLTILNLSWFIWYRMIGRKNRR